MLSSLQVGGTGSSIRFEVRPRILRFSGFRKLDCLIHHTNSPHQLMRPNSANQPVGTEPPHCLLLSCSRKRMKIDSCVCLHFDTCSVCSLKLFCFEFLHHSSVVPEQIIRGQTSHRSDSHNPPVEGQSRGTSRHDPCTQICVFLLYFQGITEEISFMPPKKKNPRPSF